MISIFRLFPITLPTFLSDLDYLNFKRQTQKKDLYYRFNFRWNFARIARRVTKKSLLLRAFAKAGENAILGSEWGLGTLLVWLGSAKIRSVQHSAVAVTWQSPAHFVCSSLALSSPDSALGNAAAVGAATPGCRRHSQSSMRWTSVGFWVKMVPPPKPRRLYGGATTAKAVVCLA